MNEKISSYLDSVIPKKISKDKRQKLFDELSCHIEEKAAGFEELGFSEEESLSKAFEAFAETDETRKTIFDKFDEMYHERTWWAFAAAITVFALNLLCLRLGAWIYAADRTSDPSTASSVAFSFVLLFAIVSSIITANARKLRKTLLGIAGGLFAVAAVPVWNVFAQYSVHACFHFIPYFLNEYTNVFIQNTDAFDYGEFAVNYIVLPLTLIIYCIVQSARIKNGKTKTEPKNKQIKRYAVFASVYICIAAVLSAFTNPIYCAENSPSPLDNQIYMTTQTDNLLYDIADCKTQKECDAVLRDGGMKTLEEYRNSLTRTEQKKLDFQVKAFQIPDSFTTYILTSPYNARVRGNGFVFLESDGENVTLKGAGGTYIPPDGERLTERLSPQRGDITIGKVNEIFSSLKKGETEENLLLNSDFLYGMRFARFIYGENMRTTAYRVVFHNRISNEQGNNDNYVCIMNLIFTDGVLSDANMRCDTYSDEQEFSTVYQTLGN